MHSIEQENIFVKSSRSGNIWRCTVADSTVRRGRIQVKRWRKNKWRNQFSFFTPLPLLCPSHTIIISPPHLFCSATPSFSPLTWRLCVPPKRQYIYAIVQCVTSRNTDNTITSYSLPLRLAWHLTQNVPSCLYLCLGLTWRNWPFIFNLHSGMSLFLG
jgi:hypothetical protein